MAAGSPLVLAASKTVDSSSGISPDNQTFAKGLFRVLHECVDIDIYLMCNVLAPVFGQISEYRKNQYPDLPQPTIENRLLAITKSISILGIDIAKNTFQFHGTPSIKQLPITNTVPDHS